MSPAFWNWIRSVPISHACVTRAFKSPAWFRCGPHCFRQVTRLCLLCLKSTESSRNVEECIHIYIYIYIYMTYILHIYIYMKIYEYIYIFIFIFIFIDEYIYIYEYIHILYIELYIHAIVLFVDYQLNQLDIFKDV